MRFDTIPRGLNGHSPAREGIRDHRGINGFAPSREGARDRTPGGSGGGSSRREGWKD